MGVDFISLLEEVKLMGGLQKFRSLLSVKTILLQIFSPAQQVVLAAERKTSFGSLIEEVAL